MFTYIMETVFRTVIEFMSPAHLEEDYQPRTSEEITEFQYHYRNMTWNFVEKYYNTLEWDTSIKEKQD